MAKVKIVMHRAKSSNIDAYGYLPSASMLFIRFKSGRTYGYSEVPKTIYSDLCGATSKGSFFRRFIKQRYRDFKLDNSPEFVFVDGDTQEESGNTPEEISVLNAIRELPTDARWAW